MIKDDEEFIYELGISKELGEHSLFEAPVCFIGDCTGNSHDNEIIYIHPPVNKDKIYFQIYDDIDISKAKRLARISMTKPEYIHCNDCSKEEWILSEDEKDKFIPIIQSKWECIKRIFAKEVKYEPSYERCVDWILGLPMPDYTQLPTK